MCEINFILGSNSKLDFLFFDTGLLFPRIRAPRATFKDVLIAFKGMAKDYTFPLLLFSTLPLDIETCLVWFIMVLYNDAFILILDCQFRLDNASR